MESPLVSVCIPLYKSAFLQETLDSLSNQSYRNIEVILVNDGDDFDYNGVIPLFPLLNIKYLKQSNKGAGAARNLAFKNTEGKYIKFLDADDLIDQFHLEKQVKLIRQNPDSIVSAKWGRFHENDLSTFKLEEESIYKDCMGVDWIIESWKQGANMTQPGIFLVPKALIEKYGLWKEELSNGPCDDLEFFTRLMVNTEIKFCHEATLLYRSGNLHTLSGKKSAASFAYYFKTLMLASNHLLRKRNGPLALEASATQFQILGFKAYPYNRQISKQSFREVARLGGSNYNFEAGGFTKILNTFIGWKNTIWFKKVLGFTKFN